MKSRQRRAIIHSGLSLALSFGAPGLLLAGPDERRVRSKSPPVWTGFGLNGSADAARFELTRRFVERKGKAASLSDPWAFEFLREPLHDMLARQNPPLVQLSKQSVTVGEELVVGMAHDYEAAVAVRRVELNKSVRDGFLFTFMSGTGLVLGFQKSVGWRVVSSFSFMTRDERPIADVSKLQETAISELGNIYVIHAQHFVTFLGRFNKWREGFAPNYFARVVSATVGKKAGPKLAEHRLEKLITPELLGFEASSAICDGLNIPLIPFKENDALANRYAAIFSEDLITQNSISLPDSDLEFEINLVDLNKEKVPSRQRGIITIRRQLIISFRAFERTGNGPDARKKLLQTFAAAPIDEDVIGHDTPDDDTPERDFVFFGRLLSRTLNLLMTGIAAKDSAKLEAVGIKYEDLAPFLPTLLERCAVAR